MRRIKKVSVASYPTLITCITVVVLDRKDKL